MAEPLDVLTGIAASATSTARTLLSSVTNWSRPSLRLGVTGLSRAGKTVFITALIHALTTNARLPVFRAGSEGRIRRAWLEPQPDDAVPRFSYESHLAALTGPDRHWPESTSQIAELRVMIEFESRTSWFPGPRTLALDIVDYPGEWLLDLALLDKTYAQWARETLAACRSGVRLQVSEPFLRFIDTLDADAPADEQVVEHASALFKASLEAARKEPFSLFSLPPGRFLMPGDLAGSPALTFAPMEVEETQRSGSLGSMMARRYESYRRHVVRPFFRDHFARLDRQIVLVDLMSALNAGQGAITDLEKALDGALGVLRTGSNTMLSRLFQPRIDKVLFAATKADYLHHTSHDRLEAILSLVVQRAISRAESLGAEIDIAGIASVRATREATIRLDGEALPAIVGVPQAGEVIDQQEFDGEAESAIFPGELPSDPALALSLETGNRDLRFVKFRPPMREGAAALPHIRLDRALEFLLGDRLS